MTNCSVRLLHFLCNKGTFKLLLASLLVLSLFKLCKWQGVYNTAFEMIREFGAADTPTNGNYYTAAKYEPSEPIDLVYTWVNGTDERLLEQMSRYADKLDQHRYADNNEMLYSLRSVEKYASWVRHIYILTNGQIPSWLNLENPRITVVPHSDICPPEMVGTALPTFSSMAIEMMLHRITNLSERFIYLNDDIYLGQPLHLDDMRSEKDGIYVVTTTWDFDYCAETCAWESISNDVCEDGCNVAACNFDGGDCDPFPLEHMFANGTMVEDMKGARPDHVPARELSIGADQFTASLVHTHGVLTTRYGFKRRQMIAHVGFLVDRNVMYDMERVFGNEMRATMNHRFRHGRDSLQFGLAYHGVLLNEMRQRTDDEIFEEFDIDRDGVWSHMEIRYFLVEYHKTDVLKWQHVEDFCNMMRTCFAVNHPELSTDNSPHMEQEFSKVSVSLDKLGCAWKGVWDIRRLMRSEILTCPALVLRMRERFATVRKYKATEQSAASWKWTFHGITNNSSDAKHAFNDLRRTHKLFNCINNDISSDKPDFYESKEYEEIVALWQKFYFSQFPLQSEFELPSGIRNGFRYVDEWRAWHSSQQYFQIIILFGFVLSCCVADLFICQHAALKRATSSSNTNDTDKNNIQYEPLLNASSVVDK